MKETAKAHFYYLTWALFLTPALFILLILVLFPALYSIFLSLHDKTGFSQKMNFYGLENYVSLLKEKEFWLSIKTGAIYSLSSTLIQIVFGIGAAAILHKKSKGASSLRSLVFLPYLVPSVIAVIIWMFLLNNSIGYINHLLIKIGLPTPNWFAEDNLIITLIIVSTWQFSSFVFLVAFARIQSIPHDLYDMAELDGAKEWRKFFSITLPQLKSVIIAVLLLRSVVMLMKFDIPWLLGGSLGSGRNLYTPAIYTYRQVFLELNISKGFAATTLYMLILAIFLAIALNLMKDRYESVK